MIIRALLFPVWLLRKAAGALVDLGAFVVGVTLHTIGFVFSRVFGTAFGAVVGLLLGRKRVGVKLFPRRSKKRVKKN